MSFLAEVDIDQSSVSTSYISLPETNDDLQDSCHSLCDQERGCDYKSNPFSYYSTSEILLQEEASPSQSENLFSQLQSLESYNACAIDYKEDGNSGKSQSCCPSTCSFSENASKGKSDFEIVVEGIPLHVDQIHISPKDLHDYMKISLLEEDDQPSDLKGDGCTDLFSEECNHPVTIFVSEENFIAIQYQKYENIVETRHVKDGCLPLCFPSFEWLKKGLKVSDHQHKFDIVDECINFLGMDDEQEG